MNKKNLKRINAILKRFGLKLGRLQADVIFKSQHVHDPQYSYLIDPELQGRLHQELSDQAQEFFSGQFPQLASSTAGSPERIKQFFEIWGGRSLFENTGGSGFHNAFWIYLFTKALQPELIVESGVWKGHTTWLFQQAAPQAEIHGFDISLKRLEFEHPRVSFHEQDWGDFVFPQVDPDSSLVFFDCHVNHAQRILEAKSKGFKHLIFDDNPPLHKIYSYGLPGYPTAAMLWSGDLPASDPTEWLWKGKPCQASFDRDQAEQARALIKKHILFPDVGGPTRYGGFSFLTYVEV